MIQLKATCLRCEGTGYLLQYEDSKHHLNIHCPECKGQGTIILDDRKWDIIIERVPPFSVEEMKEMRGK